MKTVRLVFVCTFILGFLSPLSSKVFTNTFSTELPEVICVEDDSDTRIYNEFLTKIRKRESNHNYKEASNMPYWGAYQIGPIARKAIGVKMKWREYKNNPEYQDYAMYRLLKYNTKLLGDEFISQYYGKKINGTVVTYSGMLAGAHLGGALGLKRYLRSNGKKNPHDKFGTKIGDYVKLFSGYDFNIEKVALNNPN